MIAIVGSSHAAVTFNHAAGLKGFVLSNPEIARLVIVAEDTPTVNGVRDLEPIRKLVFDTHSIMRKDATLVLSSQVPPGFTRSLGLDIYHQSETLRIKDAMDRALNPEQIIIGCEFPDRPLPDSLNNYAKAFNCPILQMTWEEAEFSKIAINMTLASQVDNTNRLALACMKVGANWAVVSQVLKNDRRIGYHSYLEPGRWQDSQHLLRDYVTLQEING